MKDAEKFVNRLPHLVMSYDYPQCFLFSSHVSSSNPASEKDKEEEKSGQHLGYKTTWIWLKK